MGHSAYESYRNKYVKVNYYAEGMRIAKFQKQRKEANVRAHQIAEKSGPASMEWIQSALFLHAVRKAGLQDDLKKALWAYTAAMIERLEKYITKIDHVAKSKNIPDYYKWVAKQLRVAITRHMKLLGMADEDILVPPVSDEGYDIRQNVHYPNEGKVQRAFDYVVGEYRQNNPDAEDSMPLSDKEIESWKPKNTTKG